MKTSNSAVKKRRHTYLRIISLSVFLVLVVASVLLYRNFNRLLSDALHKSFDATPVGEVYELKFENLRSNFWEGDIRVFNVSMVPREKPLNHYPYINSSFRLNAHEIKLESVEVRTLLKLNQLILKKILIAKPEIQVTLDGEKHIMLPFRDSTTVVSTEEKVGKKSIAAFLLTEFDLVDASFKVTNLGKQREYNIKNFNISVSDLLVSLQSGKYMTSCQKVNIAIGRFEGAIQREAVSHLAFKDFEIGVDSLALQLSLDTLTYQFHDFNVNLDDLDIQTEDNLFHIAMKSFDLSYQRRNIKVKEISFKPNVSHEVLQKEFRFQHTEFSGSVGTLELRQVNFDSILYGQKLFIDDIALDNVSAAIFKDKTKPIDSARRPVYLGQTVSGIRMPILINHVKATNVQLENTERKPDSTYAKVTISKGALELKNITNLSAKEGLGMKADAYINGKVRFNALLNFSYQAPLFTFQGEVKKFDLPDLNSLIQSYTPAKINTGTADEIIFSGVAKQSAAKGTMKFLYHNLEVDLELQKQARWKSSVVAFAANTALNSNNPASPNVPPRIVTFHIERDLTKGFINVIIKSVLNGLKETMMMSKENRKAYQETKKKAKQRDKE